MKNWILPLVIFSLVGCSSDSSKNQKDADTTKTATASESSSTDVQPVVYTIFGAEDGYESEIYFYVENDDLVDEEDLPDFNELHVIPSYVGSDGLDRGMIYMNRSSFHLYEPFSTFSGRVVVFYDKEKRHRAAEYTVDEGRPNGVVKVYTPKGRVQMECTYDMGVWTKTRKSPASSDWSFDQAASNLSVRDLHNGKSTVEGKTIIELMPGVGYEYSDYENILDKSTYIRTFNVNGQPFTGQLVAHNYAPEPEPHLAFELDFKDGLLHGDIMVYSEFFGLSLHEIFVEGELEETVYVLDASEMDGVAKPVIYLYPEDTTDITVQLEFEGDLTHTYPRYNDLWKVQASPDGTLFDAKGQEYYALYWEGDNKKPFTLNEGNVVKGENTIEFLETTLETLGLNRREANEFIMYWLPQMEGNAYNLIHFSTEEYEQMAKLSITPEPETMIRVMMVFQPLKRPISIPEQSIASLKKERKGFTVVEWGGKKVTRPDL